MEWNQPIVKRKMTLRKFKDFTDLCSSEYRPVECVSARNKNFRLRNKKPLLVLHLKHGTGRNPPAEFFKKDWLTIAYSEDSGYWGKGN